MTLFQNLSLSPNILKALAEEGYDTATPIQTKAIPPALAGRDVLGTAQTGTGKTAAFVVPILERFLAAGESRRRASEPRALILAPTRELASQIDESFTNYGRHVGITHTVIFGGVSQHRQVHALRAGVDVLVATPGRLLDLLEQRLVTLGAVRILVLDEADRMLDMGFIPAIRKIAALIPKQRQTLLFSATMPTVIARLAESLLHNPIKVAVDPVASAAPLIEQAVYYVERDRKPALLKHLLADRRIERALVFTRTKHGADKLSKRLERSGETVAAIHGNKAQNQRERALEGFRSGRARVLVATDVAARGLDVDGITHVFNFDLPNEPEAYVHRIGRTGRAGASGTAIAFCDHQERPLLRDIERLTGKPIAPLMVPDSLPVEAPAAPSAHRAHRPAGQQRTGQQRTGQQRARRRQFHR